MPQGRRTMMLRNLSFAVLLMLVLSAVAEGRPRRILLDTDVDTDDFFALLYLLKVNRSEFNLEAVTINGNSWTDAGHAVNHIYDLLYMMGRDDVAVGMGGEGGIAPGGEILPDVGGYLPVVEQGSTTAGYCRYRQAIPVGRGGRLDIDTNYGIRKEFLPQGRRRYIPLKQATVQQVLIEKVSQGPITILMAGTHTSIAIFLMNNPSLKKNVERIYVMGGGLRSRNPTGCCPRNSTPSSCRPRQCGDRGNLFSNYQSNPYAEFNFFGDPFAAYQVIHSGVPITVVPLDATNTIPITENFFQEFEKMQKTYEAQYCYRSLKITKDTWFDDQFYRSYFMWDSFMSGVAVSSMRSSNGENAFAEMEYMNITVVTSNAPYGVDDGSNPRFDLEEDGVHSGHLQTGLRDPVCFVENGKGKCMDGYTKEVPSPSSEGVRVLVAVEAKQNPDVNSKLEKAFHQSFLEVMNGEEQAGKFNFSSEFPDYREVYYTRETRTTTGKPLIFDMDMSAGDFLALMYLLKAPRELIDLRAVIVSATGWANAATIDIIYDVLHMMGRDDVPVGLGEMFAIGQSDPTIFGVGGCKYVKVIPHGSGGLLDSDTLYGLARHLPRSPRRYTAETSVRYGAARDTDHPELRQPSALEVWESVTAALTEGEQVTILVNGPLSNLARIVKSTSNASSVVKEVFIVGGDISGDEVEMNMFLDPLAAKVVFESFQEIILIPLAVQREVSSFPAVLDKLRRGGKTTPEASFSTRLLTTLERLKKSHLSYEHVEMFLGEIVGAVVVGSARSEITTSFLEESVRVIAEGDESRDGMTVSGDTNGTRTKVLKGVDTEAYYTAYAGQLKARDGSARIGSFEEQKRVWRRRTNREDTYCKRHA